MDHAKRFLDKERMVLLGIILIALYFGFFSFEYQIGALNDPQSGFFPLVISLLVLAIAGWLFISGRKSAPAPANGCAEPTAGANPAGAKQILLTITAVMAYTLVIERLGFVVPSFLLFLALLKIMKLPGWGFPLGLSLAVALGAWCLFKLWLGVQLPGGPWGF